MTRRVYNADRAQSTWVSGGDSLVGGDSYGLGMANSSQVSPYGSARDLPSVKEMERKMAAFRLLGSLLPKEQRKQLKDLQREHRRLTEIVDKFYTLLGERNWVFTGDLNLPAIEHVIDGEDPVAAEARLIDYYKSADRISFPLRRLYRFEAMCPRIDLLQKAYADYEAHRYYNRPGAPFRDGRFRQRSRHRNPSRSACAPGGGHSGLG